MDGRQPAILTDDASELQASESHRVCSSMNSSAQEQTLVSRENGTMWESHVDASFQSARPYDDNAYFTTMTSDHFDRRRMLSDGGKVDQQQSDQFAEQHRDSSAGHKPRIDTCSEHIHSPESAAAAAAMASCRNVSTSSSLSSSR
eukprot:scaffold137776_cov17-Prasinocladus_malaysianus.AAC.1